MKIKKQIGNFALLILVSFSLLHANETVCPKDTNYFLTHFAEAKDPENFNLRWARCEKKLGNEDGAMSAYERVLIENPNNVEAMTVLAGMYRANHMDFASKELKHTVDNSRLTPEQRQIVSQLLEGKESLVSTRFSATLNVGYDNNLNFGIFTKDAGMGKGDVSSTFHSLLFRGNYVNELDTVGGFSIQSNIDFYWQDNYSAHYYDVLYGSIDAGLGYSISNVLFYFPLVYRRIKNLDTDLYEQYGIAPRLTASLGDGLLMNIELKYLKRKYIDTLYKNADDTLSNASIGFYQFYGENYIYAQVKYNHFNADSVAPAPFTEYDYFQLFAGVSYEIKGFAIAGINYQYGHGNYNDSLSPIDSRERKDDFNQFNISLQRDITSELKVLANYTYADNDSNYDPASYDKQIITIGLQYNY
jgi:hypothetical protein